MGSSCRGPFICELFLIIAIIHTEDEEPWIPRADCKLSTLKFSTAWSVGVPNPRVIQGSAALNLFCLTEGKFIKF